MAQVSPKIQKLEKNTAKTLIKVSAAFPFQFFPDTIVVDQNKTEIIYKDFFWNKKIFTIMHKDLTTVKISTGPIFATVTFEIKGYETNPGPVRYLWKKDAIRLYETIIGINTVIKNDLDLSELPEEKMQNHAQKIGGIKEDISAPV